MATLTRNKAISIASIVWLVCIAAAFFAAIFRQLDVGTIWPVALIGSVPAIMSLVLSPFLKREWAQIVVIFSWIALAIMACLAIKFIPMAVLFLCAPAIAALFEKEKVIETMVLAAIAAAAMFYFEQYGGENDQFGNVSLDQINWGISTAMAATIGLLIATLYGAAGSGQDVNGPAPVQDNFLEAVPGGLFRVGLDDHILESNAVAKAQLNLGKNPQVLKASDVFLSDKQSDDLMYIINTARKDNKKVSRKFDMGSRGGLLKTAEITAAPLNNGEVLLHVYDSSSHEARLQALHDAQSTARKDADSKTLFFAGVSHELRTPLNAIIGFSDMMRSRLFGPLPGKYAEYADLIHDSGQHMLDLIGDVLDMSKVEAGKYELVYNHFDAADVIRSSAKMLRPAADNAEIQMDIEIRSEQGELLVEADRKALRQIILNLLSNAIKFTPKGGRVLVKGDIDGSDVIIGVIDNGEGMSKRELELVGKPFMQSESGKNNEARGSGLGLSLVKSLAELHGGRFKLSSSKGVGTTAEVFIPQQRR